MTVEATKPGQKEEIMQEDVEAEQVARNRTSMRDWVRSWYVPFLRTARDFVELNEETSYTAALEYVALGWYLITLNRKGKDLCGGRVGAEMVFQCYPAQWEYSPKDGMGIRTGTDSGIVGLWVSDQSRLEQVEAKFGPLPFPRIIGKYTAICFRAPVERFPARVLDAGIAYVGEADFLQAPPTIHKGVRLQWQPGESDGPLLPELPVWLHSYLAGCSSSPGSRACSVVRECVRPVAAGYVSPLGL